MNQLRVARGYSAAEADDPVTAGADGGLHLRVIIALTGPDRYDSPLSAAPEPRWLQLLQPVPEQIAHNANQVQQGFRDYQELALSRLGLRKLYGITLTLALLLAAFGAIAVALSLSKRLVRPLLSLAAGTQAVGVGDYRPLPEPPERDEVGQLTRSFNAMTRQLDEARRMVESNRQQLERSNVYLESVLSNLSSGVLAFDESFRVTTVNQGAQTILQADLRSVIGRPLETVGGMLEFANVVRQAFGPRRRRLRAPALAAAVRNHAGRIGRRRHRAPAADAAGARHPPAGGRPRQRLPGRVRRYHRGDFRQPHRGLGRGGAPAGPRDQEPADPDPVVGRAAGHEAGRQAAAGRGADRRALDQHHRQPGGLAQADGGRFPRIRAHAAGRHAAHRFQRPGGRRAVAVRLGPEGGGAGRFGEKALNLDVTLEAGLPAIEGDPTQLRQVIHNLLSNARDAIAELGGEGGSA